VGGAWGSGIISWETRVAALKLIEQKKLEVGDFEAYPRLMKSRHVAERYRFVRTLGSSRRTSTHRDLLSFLDDRNPHRHPLPRD
jgi:hypothetical protein